MPRDAQRTLAANEEDIAYYEQRAELLRKGSERKCRACGAALVPDCAFCMECGARVEDAAPEQPVAKAAERVCSFCGFHVTDPEAMFCNNCGTPLGEASVSEDNARDNGKKRCPNCGFTSTDPEVLFCMECGTKLV